MAKAILLKTRDRRHNADGTVDIPGKGLSQLQVRTDVSRRKIIPKGATHYVELPVEGRSPDLGYWVEDTKTPSRRRQSREDKPFDPFRHFGRR